jgi:CRP-like cAMP-binding protein
MPHVERTLELLVRKLAMHIDLDEDDRNAILALPTVLRTLDASSYIIREGEPPTQCAVLISGFAYRQKLTGEGARQIVSLHIPGDALDFQHLFLDVADHNVQTLTRATIATVPRAALRELARTRPAIGNAILIDILIEGSIFREWVLNVGRRDARTRVAHLLCEFASRLQAQGLAEDYGFELPMTQEQLGDAVGLTAVHVNRTLKSLQADGLIERDRRRITFPQWQAMIGIADFSQRYLHIDEHGEAAR